MSIIMLIRKYYILTDELEVLVIFNEKNSKLCKNIEFGLKMKRQFQFTALRTQKWNIFGISVKLRKTDCYIWFGSKQVYSQVCR